ncbi:cytochrome c oxidase subunit II [Bacillus marinisedimentorum]|uniref:cytochrome c oxidase subunit II n=1 Tax=Bacillus marinisedimentorum TaxID=1821260 RepID=UPI0007E0BA1F|nr:cytochrome c oxidase subunit II [Bacillus marinisedimentorum]
MKRWHQKWRLFAVFGMLALILAGCGDPYLSALQPKGVGAEMQYDLMLISVAIMAGVFLVVMVIYTFVIMKFRAKKGDENKIPKQVEGNHTLEIIWTVIPILLLLILAVPTVAYTFKLADTEKKAENTVVVDVTAYQYWWEFDYPDLGIKTSQDLYIPAEEEVIINLKSQDVIHSFWVPALSGKMDTNPGDGNNNTMTLHAKEEGTYLGKCAELCGPSHALMDFKVQAVDRNEFDAWAEKMKAGPSEPQTETAKAGQEIFQQSCVGCHAVGEEGGNLGPNLTNFGERERIAGILEHNEENLRKWMKDPETVKPGNKMTGQYDELDDKELDALVDYLMGLKVTEEKK